MLRPRYGNSIVRSWVKRAKVATMFVGKVGTLHVLMQDLVHKREPTDGQESI